MIGLYIFAGITVFFCLLLSLNASVRVIFNSADKANMKIYAKIGFYKINIIPLRQKKIKKKRFKLFGRRRRKNVKKAAEKKLRKKVEKSDAEKAGKKKQYSKSELIGLAKDMCLIFFEKLKKHLKIKIYKMSITAGEKDAYKTAMLYANINRGAYYIYEILNNNFNFKIINADIRPDFLSGKTNFDIDLKISIRIGAGLGMAAAMAINFIKFRSKNK